MDIFGCLAIRAAEACHTRLYLRDKSAAPMGLGIGAASNPMAPAMGYEPNTPVGVHPSFAQYVRHLAATRFFLLRKQCDPSDN